MKSTTSTNIFTLLVALQLIMMFFPISNMMIFVAIAVITILMGVSINLSQKLKSALLCILAFIAVELIYSFFGNGMVVPIIIYNGVVFLAAIVICHCFNKLSKKQMNILCNITIGLFLYSITASFILLLTDPNIIRGDAFYLDSGGGTATIARYGGLLVPIPYGLGEALSIVVPLLLAYSFSVQQRKEKLLILAIVFGGILIQIMGALATSALLTIIFSLVIFFKYIRNKGNRLVNLLPLILVIVAIALYFIPQIDISENIQLIAKMEDVQDSYRSGQSNGQVSTRSELYMQSIHVFLSNPLFGLGTWPSEYGHYTEDSVSLHTAMFDYLGLFGLFTLMFYAAWKKSILSSMQILPKDRQKYYRWVFASLLLLLVFKGPVSIGTNFLCSTVIFGIIVYREYNNSLANNKNEE